MTWLRLEIRLGNDGEIAPGEPRTDLRATAIKPLPSRYVSRLLPISQSVHAHRTKPTELLNCDVVGSGGLERGHQRLPCHLPLTWRSRLLYRLGGWHTASQVSAYTC